MTETLTPQQLPVDALIAALRTHAEAMAATAPVSTAMPAINALREAALAYVEAVAELTGWENVFADLYGEGEDDDEAEPEATDAVTGITVLSRHDYAVTDEEAVMAAGREAYMIVWPNDDDAAAAADALTAKQRA